MRVGQLAEAAGISAQTIHKRSGTMMNPQSAQETTVQKRAHTKEVQALPDGYAFRFPAEQATVLLISEFMARERLCCPFFTFELVTEQEDGPLWLRLRVREGVKDFIRAEFGIK